MIVNGWLDWAIKLPGRKDFTYEGTNQARGIFLHSAEGYRDGLLDLALNGPLSWHFSNMFNGDFYQHHPITTRCWHASAANFDYLGCENEGIGDINKGRPDPTLLEPQIQNNVRLISELEIYTGKKASRFWPSIQFLGLCEHTEVTRIGGTATACPSGRIPWDEILRRLTNVPTDDEIFKALIDLAYFIHRGWDLNDMSDEYQKAVEVAVQRMRDSQHG